MYRYKITLLSKDNQKYEYLTKNNSKKEAIESAFKEIELKGWDHYQYKVMKSQLL